MVGHGGSSAGSYLADPTSPIPSHCASIVMTSTLRVKSSVITVPGQMSPRSSIHYPLDQRTKYYKSNKSFRKKCVHEFNVHIHCHIANRVGVEYHDCNRVDTHVTCMLSTFKL